MLCGIPKSPQTPNPPRVPTYPPLHTNGAAAARSGCFPLAWQQLAGTGPRGWGSVERGQISGGRVMACSRRARFCFWRRFWRQGPVWCRMLLVSRIIRFASPLVQCLMLACSNLPFPCDFCLPSAPPLLQPKGKIGTLCASRCSVTPVTFVSQSSSKSASS